MIATYRTYLTEKLVAAGIKSKVFTSMKELKAYQDSHVGAILPATDTLTRSHSKTIYTTADGKFKRRKLYDRVTTMVVVIGEYDQVKADEIFSRFLAELDAGIMVDGNYTATEVEDADWVDKEDSVLQAKVAAQIKIRFNGGIYKDTGFAPVNQAYIQVEKEGSHGNQG